MQRKGTIYTECHNKGRMRPAQGRGTRQKSPVQMGGGDQLPRQAVSLSELSLRPGLQLADDNAGEIQRLILIGGLSMSTELYIEPERRDRNAINGQFLKGSTPHNKGKKWNEWMDMRKAKRVKRIGMRNLHGRSDIGGWNARPVFALDKDGNTVGWFASSYDAERKTGICARNIRAVLEGRRKYAGGYRWIRQD